jgi:hypothetical protein
MSWSRISWNPSRRVLREFAVLSLALFAGLACQQAYQGNALRASLYLILAIVVAPTLAWPGLIRPLFLAAQICTFPIGWTAGWLTLAVVYYGVVTPLGLVFALAGRDPLARRHAPGLESYWVARDHAEVRSYFRPF